MSAPDFFSGSDVLWKPLDPSAARVEVFRRLVNRKHGLKLKHYHDLHEYSVSDHCFWPDIWQYLGIISSVPPDPGHILDNGPLASVPVWFPEARLNYAENLLHRIDDAIACTACRDDGVVVHYSYRRLRKLVAGMSNALRSSGLSVGDRVAAIITNSITAVIIALATASIGGIFSSTATDLGAQGILDRYLQIKPKFVFAETHAVYGGKHADLIPKLITVATQLQAKGMQNIILLPDPNSSDNSANVRVPGGVDLASFLAKGSVGAPLRFEQLPFSQPLFILYSSGTSGPPKCIVHSAGGMLLQGMKDLAMGMDVGRDDTYFHFTTTGWMMWTFQLSALALGARIILYDGSPFYPDVRTFLRTVHDQGVTLFGTSPRFLSEIQGKGINPLDIAPFDSLRRVFVTGAVLTPPLSTWTQQAFGKNVHIVSSSGGTDIGAAFVTGIPSLPMHAGEIQGKSLGMKVEVFDPEGQNIEHTARPGELVCTRAHVSLPVKFWGDDTGEKFRQAYFETYPGIWKQGDFIVVNPITKGIMILGRSDGVLNPSGVRFGSGEIYAVMERFSAELDDYLCVGQRRPQDNDERVLLFVKLRPGHTFTQQLSIRIQLAIRTNLSARHVPAYIFEIEDIPYTVNGKKIEITVKQIVSGYDLKPSGTVANPASLGMYYKYRDIERIVGLEGRKVKL